MKKSIFSFLMLVFLSISFLSAQEKINQLDNDGKRDGVWEKFHPNKLVRYTGQFKNGKEIGVFKFYKMTTNDFPEIVKTFSEKSDSAKVEYYNDKGIVESKGFMINKDRVGKWLYFNDDGKTIMTEENYENGVLHGLSKTFYPNKKLTEVKNYTNGKLNGSLKRYADNGTLLDDLMYSNGKLDGLAKYYNLKGVLIFTGDYENDIKVGDWKYYENGKKVSIDKLKQ